MPENTLFRISSLRYYVLGLAVAPIFMAFFASMWWGMGEVWNALPGGLITFGVVLAVISILLLGGAIVIMRTVRRLPVDRSPEAIAYGRERGRFYGKWFGIIFGLEIVLISVTNILLYSVLNHPEYAMPIMALIVGVHFLPLAPVFQVKLYYVTGTLVALMGVIMLIAVPVTQTIGQARAWDVILGLSCAPLLWLTGFYTIGLSQRILAKANGMVQTMSHQSVSTEPAVG